MTRRIQLKAIPNEYRQGREPLGRGWTSIAFDREDGKVDLFTICDVKYTYLSERFGIGLAEDYEWVADFAGFDVMHLVVPKLYKLNKENHRVVNQQIKHIDKYRSSIRDWNKSVAYNNSEFWVRLYATLDDEHNPTTDLVPIWFAPTVKYVMYWDDSFRVLFDAKTSNVMQDLEGNIIPYDVILDYSVYKWCLHGNS